MCFYFLLSSSSFSRVLSNSLFLRVYDCNSNAISNTHTHTQTHNVYVAQRKNCSNKKVCFLLEQILRLNDDDEDDDDGGGNSGNGDEDKKTDFFLLWKCCC